MFDYTNSIVEVFVMCMSTELQLLFLLILHVADNA